MGVYYKDGKRLYWPHAGRAGQCPKSDDNWMPVDYTTWTDRYHERPTNAGKGWKDDK